ncbi:hypothetical protein EC32303_A0025 [Escherichia coli 3.2303]|nr:hypothetical protein EC32303_A0025 [Escherichia coli 3.2303]
MHLAVTGDWPDEAAPLQAFGEEAQSVTVSPTTLLSGHPGVRGR